jgi:hypothetical protein
VIKVSVDLYHKNKSVNLLSVKNVPLKVTPYLASIKSKILATRKAGNNSFLFIAPELVCMSLLVSVAVSQLGVGTLTLG